MLRVSALLLSVLAVTLSGTGATPLVPTYSSCIDAYAPVAPAAAQLNVKGVYGNLLSSSESKALNLNGAGHDVLRVDLVGSVGQDIVGYDNTTGKLATLFTMTTAAGVSEYSSTTWLCNSLFPSTLPEPYFPDNVTYCPMAAGDFAINLSIPLYKPHVLTTLRTQVRIVDTSVPAQSLACIDVLFTPYDSGGWPYKLFLWLPASVAIGYWTTSWAARFAAGWVVGADRTEAAQRETTKLKWGTMIISGLSGERFGVSAALLRFVTPGLRDIIHHIQFVAMLGMIGVAWPPFFYPIVAQTAWADLLWNVTLVSDQHPSTSPDNYTAPAEFSFMLDNSYYPLYLNSSTSNPLLDLHGASDGMESFAQVVGLYPKDLFGTCLVLFLIIAAIIIIVHLALWLVHFLTEILSRDVARSSYSGRAASRNSLPTRNSLGGNSRTSSSGYDGMEPPKRGSAEYGQVLTQASLANRSSPSPPTKLRRIWTRFRPKGEAGAFHFAALYGNLLRLVLTFHFPITALSIYQLAMSNASVVSRVFAALAFIFISVLIPVGILIKISRTPTGKLYDAARTLLALGTVYNVYEQEKQLYRSVPLAASLVSGIVIGAVQKSGFAQAVILIFVEIASLISTTLWLPWGQGASMNTSVIFIAILRISTMVMVMVLSPTIGLDEVPQDWVTYAILLLQAIIFIFYLLMLLTKIIEGIIRLIGGAPFDESTHPLDGGIFAAIMDLDCLNGVRGGKAAARRRRKRGSRQLQRNVSAAGSLTTQMMLDRHSQGVQRPVYPILDPASETAQRGTYFPVATPPSSYPMSERISSDSRLDDNRIMDAWRPGYGTVSSLSSPIEQSRQNDRLNNGRLLPTVRVITGDEQHEKCVKPSHNRAKSSSAVVEELDSYSSTTPPLLSSPLMSPSRGMKPDNNGMLPPPLAIPRQRSLNNMRDDSPPVSSGKRRPRATVGWFTRGDATNDNGEPESDDEPGPSSRPRLTKQRERGPTDEIVPPERPRGWRAFFTRSAAPEEMDEQTRDENAARKAAAVNESGALLAGVASRSFVVTRKAHSGASLTGTHPSFKVSRGVIPSGIPSHPGSPSVLETAAKRAEPTRSFRVIRPSRTDSPSAAFHVSRSEPTSWSPVPVPANISPLPEIAPAIDTEHPSPDNPRDSLGYLSARLNRTSSDAPDRPPRNPRRSEDSIRPVL